MFSTVGQPEKGQACRAQLPEEAAAAAEAAAAEEMVSATCSMSFSRTSIATAAMMENASPLNKI